MDEVDIDMGTDRNLREGGRNLVNHGHQIENEIPGSNPMRNIFFTESLRQYLEYKIRHG